MRVTLTSLIVDEVHGSPVAYADTPLVLVAFQFLATGCPGFSLRASSFETMPTSTGSGSVPNSFREEGFTSTA